MIFDGDCSFCRYWIDRWRAMTGDKVEYAPYQSVAGQFPTIPREQFAEAVHLISADGQVSRGAEAVFRSLAMSASWSWMLWMYLRVPGVAWLCERSYQWVARHRSSLYRWMGFFGLK